MDIGTMLGDAFEYTRDALVGKWMRWLILLIGTIIFPIILGYTLRVYRGEPNPPDPRDWVAVFIDGIKLFIVELIWAIPVIIVLLIFFGGAIALMTSGSNAATAAGIGTMLIGLPILIIVTIVVAIFATMGAVRFARTDSFGEAFNISAILAHIGRIGWGPYILALIVLMAVLFVISFVLGIIPIIGWLISIVLGPAISIFAARYITLLYDSAPAPALPLPLFLHAPAFRHPEVLSRRGSDEATLMDIGTMLGDAYEYTKDALVGNWMRWLILLIGTIIFPILLGYTLLVYRGERTPPDPQDWVAVFIDGIKLFVVQLVYAIPIIVLAIVINLALFIPFSVASGSNGMSGDTSGVAIGLALVLGLIQIALSIAISLISIIASIRFARTDSFSEAFNISAILAHIGRIGWGSYILALIVLYIALLAIVVVLTILGVLTLGLGFLLFIALAPAFSIFVARYVTLIYDSASAPA